MGRRGSLIKRMELYICGCRGSFSVFGAEFQEFGGATTCYVLKDGHYAMVLDCGSGLINAKKILADCARVDVILSHLHYDHIIGILSFGIFPRNAGLRFFSGFSAPGGTDVLRQFMGEPFWPCTMDFGEVHQVEAPCSVELYQGWRMNCLPSNHPGDAMIVQLEGHGKKISALWDYEHGAMDLSDWVSGSDLLCYDGMFSPEDYPSHHGWGHSTWLEGCKLAARANVKTLIVTHHNSAHSDEVLRAMEAEAKGQFPFVCFAREGDCITL